MRRRSRVKTSCGSSELGFSDAEVFDIAAAASARAFFSKLVESLGVTAEHSLLGLDQEFKRTMAVGRPSRIRLRGHSHANRFVFSHCLLDSSATSALRLRSISPRKDACRPGVYNRPHRVLPETRSRFATSTRHSIAIRKRLNPATSAWWCVASIDTGFEARDNDLRSGQVLNAAQFPEMRFESLRVTRAGTDGLRIEGTLTLHGVTKPLTLDATLNKVGPNPFDQRPTLGFSARGTLKRSEVWNLYVLAFY